MTTSTVTLEIHEFAQGVRVALADLPAEEVDDLTEGLEADLAESLAEDLRRTLPDPRAYAAELRAAAGLPAPSKSVKRGTFAGLVEGWQATRRDVAIAVRRNPALAGGLDFLVSLRPAWWIVRAWLATWLVSAFFGMERGYWFDGVWWLVLAATVVISVHWGQGRWSFPGLAPIILVGNVVAVVTLLPALSAAQSWGSPSFVEDPYMDPGTATGMTLDGATVKNIFAYDSTGKRLSDVQLFDQDGRPLVPHLDVNRDECMDGDCASDPDGNTFAPSRLETGAVVGNVFPVSLIGTILDEDTGAVSIDPTAVPQDPKAPFIKVPAVQESQKVAKAND